MTPKQQTVEESRLLLRPFTEEEYHLFFRGYEPDILSGASPFHYQREQVSRLYAYHYGGYQKDYIHYGVFRDGLPIGNLQLKRIDPAKKQCEFGIILQNEGIRNRGIGTLAIQMGLKLAHDEYGIQTVLGDTFSSNVRMLRVFEKLKFTLIEIVPAALILPTGQTADRLVYQKSLGEY